LDVTPLAQTALTGERSARRTVPLIHTMPHIVTQGHVDLQLWDMPEQFPTLAQTFAAPLGQGM
jgi:hypothetical protein